MKKLATHFHVLAPYCPLVLPFFLCHAFTSLYNICHSSSSLLPLPRLKQKSVVTFPSSFFFFSTSSTILFTPFSLPHGPPPPPSAFSPLHCNFHLPAAPPFFVSTLCSSSSSSRSFSTWGTPGSRRRWSISSLPLGFLSPV